MVSLFGYTWQGTMLCSAEMLKLAGKDCPAVDDSMWSGHLAPLRGSTPCRADRCRDTYGQVTPALLKHTQGCPCLTYAVRGGALCWTSRGRCCATAWHRSMHLCGWCKFCTTLLWIQDLRSIWRNHYKSEARWAGEMYSPALGQQAEAKGAPQFQQSQWQPQESL